MTFRVREATEDDASTAGGRGSLPDAGARILQLRAWYQDNLAAGRRWNDPTGKPSWA